MAKVERFEDLRCWQAARGLTREVYALARTGPLARDFRLRDQLTAASVSAMTNIAEGFARYHAKDFIRFLDYAQSSAAEVRSLLYVVLDQAYADAERVASLQRQSDDAKHLTLGLLRYLVRRDQPNDAANGAPRTAEPALAYAANGTSAASYDLPASFLA
jgi:four helix bundle protein